MLHETGDVSDAQVAQGVRAVTSIIEDQAPFGEDAMEEISPEADGKPHRTPAGEDWYRRTPSSPLRQRTPSASVATWVAKAPPCALRHIEQ